MPDSQDTARSAENPEQSTENTERGSIAEQHAQRYRECLASLSFGSLEHSSNLVVESHSRSASSQYSQPVGGPDGETEDSSTRDGWPPAIVETPSMDGAAEVSPPVERKAKADNVGSSIVGLVRTQALLLWR